MFCVVSLWRCVLGVAFLFSLVQLLSGRRITVSECEGVDSQFIINISFMANYHANCRFAEKKPLPK